MQGEKFRATAALTAVGALSCLSYPALAQERSVLSVTDREKVYHKEEGIEVGAFRLQPLLTVASSFDDNIYASKSNKQSDFSVDSDAEIDIVSNFQRHSISGRAHYERSFYARNPSENVSSYGANLQGRLDIDRDSAISAGTSYEHLAEARNNLGSFRGTDKPVQFTRYDATAGINRRFNLLAINVNGVYRRYSYSDAIVGGVPIDENFRNFKLYQASTQVAYSFRHRTSLLVYGELQRRRYDLRLGDAAFPIGNIDRSDNSERIEFGVRRELTEVLSGQIRVGYLKIGYSDPRVKDVGDISYSANIDWKVTPLTNLTFVAARSLDETVSPNSAGNLRDEFEFTAVHELLRNLIIEGNTRYASTSAVGIGNGSKQYYASLGSRYYVGRWLRVDADIAHSERSSSNPNLEYADNRIWLTLRLSR